MKKFINSIEKLTLSQSEANNGITLVEVIVSIALLGIMVILICNMLMTSFTITNISQRKTQNIYNVGSQVVTGNGAAPANGSVTVTLGGNPGQVVPGTYQNGNVAAGTASAVSGWSFTPNN